MDLKKVAIIKPARGNYDAGTIYTYHSETWECVTGVLGDALLGSGVGAGVAIAGRAASLISGPVGWGIFAVTVVGGALNGYADHC